MGQEKCLPQVTLPVFKILLTKSCGVSFHQSSMLTASGAFYLVGLRMHGPKKFPSNIRELILGPSTSLDQFILRQMQCWQGIIFQIITM